MAPLRHYLPMRGMLLILLMLACAAGSADARRHRHQLRYYYDAVTPAETGRPYSSPQSQPAPPPEHKLTLETARPCYSTARRHATGVRLGRD